ncbi:MAG: peroxidase-related enzyme [Desulfobulbaceae bacterium]|nr:peroxidase-related enzyme [Desulfobulbaceae bacterium]
MESHENDLREEIKDEEKTRQIQEDYTKVDLGAQNRALLDFAKKMTLEHRQMSRDDIETLRSHGFADRDILDAVQLIGYFNYTNRVMGALGIEPEPDMRFTRQG